MGGYEMDQVVERVDVPVETTIGEDGSLTQRNVTLLLIADGSVRWDRDAPTLTWDTTQEETEDQDE